MESGAQQIFVGKEDNYGGLVVNLMEMEHMTAQDFESKLDLNGRFFLVLLTLGHDLQGKRGIWIKLSSQLSSLVDSAIKRGFTYQHAENEYVVLIVLESVLLC
ncbi:unnamed protein product [Brassica oleracea]